MKRTKKDLNPLPQYDYALALQNALSWLGKRHLLAEPIARRREAPGPFFAETPRWHEVRRPVGPGGRKH